MSFPKQAERAVEQIKSVRQPVQGFSPEYPDPPLDFPEKKLRCRVLRRMEITLTVTVRGEGSPEDLCSVVQGLMDYATSADEIVDWATEDCPGFEIDAFQIAEPADGSR